MVIMKKVSISPLPFYPLKFWIPDNRMDLLKELKFYKPNTNFNKLRKDQLTKIYCDIRRSLGR